MWEPMLGDGPERAKYMADIVCGHATPALCRAGRSAALAVLLASDEATYMTGAELTIDGGLLAGSASGRVEVCWYASDYRDRHDCWRDVSVWDRLLGGSAILFKIRSELDTSTGRDRRKRCGLDVVEPNVP